MKGQQEEAPGQKAATVLLPASASCGGGSIRSCSRADLSRDDKESSSSQTGPKPPGEKRDDGQEDMGEYPHGVSLVMLTIGLMAVVLVLALDNYIISTAIPRIASDFNTLSLVGWYSSSYFLTIMAFQNAFGQLCTLFPIKLVYLISIVVFEIGSIVSASAPTSAAFIVGRLISGAAGAGLFVGTLTLVGYAVSARHRHLYMSVVTSMYGVASAAGPLLGGVFTDSPQLTWRFCFWINLPIGFVAFVAIAIFLRPPHQSQLGLTLKQKLARLDICGACLLIAGFVCLLLALQWGGITYAWSDSRVWGCLLGFGMMAVAFVALQLRLKDRATVPPRIVSQRTVAASSTFTVFVSMAINVHVYYIPFYFQSVLGATAVQSGIRTLPYLMTLLLSPMISGILISLVGYYVPFMWVGTTLLTVGSGLLFTLSPTSNQGEWIGYQFLAAFGAGICRQIGFSAVQVVLPQDDIAIGSALVAFCNSLGATLATSIGQSIFLSLFATQLSQLPGIDVAAVLNSGSLDLVPGPLLEVVRQACNYALVRALVLGIVGAGLALCCSMTMEWINLKGSKNDHDRRTKVMTSKAGERA